jgi:hypothetical protein
MTVDEEHLANYRTLLLKVDALCRRIVAAFPAQVTCRAGCDSCCRHLTLFPVEAAVLAAAVAELPVHEADRIRALGASAVTAGPCPLLEHGRCLLYVARPIICRTHGLPILTEVDGAGQVDFCPRNFQGIPSLPGEAVIHLDVVNASLAAVNALFLKQYAWVLPAGRDRLTIGEALNL